jgi:hypothetical protein
MVHAVLDKVIHEMGGLLVASACFKTMCWCNPNLMNKKCFEKIRMHFAQSLQMAEVGLTKVGPFV